MVWVIPRTRGSSCIFVAVQHAHVGNCFPHSSVYVPPFVSLGIPPSTQLVHCGLSHKADSQEYDFKHVKPN